MTIYRFEIDGDKDVEAVAVSLTLLASKIFHDRFPGPIRRRTPPPDLGRVPERGRTGKLPTSPRAGNMQTRQRDGPLSGIPCRATLGGVAEPWRRRQARSRLPHLSRSRAPQPGSRRAHGA